jgi:phage shock protein PspC (stress-responsive transcriptional regulator)
MIDDSKETGLEPLDPQTPPAGGTPPPPGDSPRKPLVRSRTDRVIGGVCAGVARYLGVDALVVRIAAVALVLLGGVGVLLYVGGLLLLPDDTGETYAGNESTRGRFFTALGVVALVGAAALVLSGAVLGALGVLVPVAFLALIGLSAWWMVSGRGIGDDWRVILRRSLAGLAVLLGCLVVFVGGGWAAAAGGGTLVAGLVIGAGVALVLGAFVRPVRFLVLPAISLALGAGFVSAAGVDLDGGVGEREYTPASASDIRDRYELGAGQLVVDLRDTRLPKGDVPVALDVGMGEAVLLVRDDVCVASRARIGMGDVRVFDRESNGVDVDWDDRRAAPAGVTRVVVDADVGFGQFRVGRRDVSHDHGRSERRGGDGPGNAACSARGGDRAAAAEAGRAG